MGNKVTDQQLSTVRSIVGSEYTDMDIIRALHLANYDATAAINIIFDTPNFKTKDTLGTQRKPRVSHSDAAGVVTNRESKQNGEDKNIPSKLEGNVTDSTASTIDITVDDVGQRLGSPGSEWWFVGCGEMAGLSTCKGRTIKHGDEVLFKFPLKKSSTSPSPGKGFARGRQAGAACSEIVRFSTKASGEVS